MLTVILTVQSSGHSIDSAIVDLLNHKHFDALYLRRLIITFEYGLLIAIID